MSTKDFLVEIGSEELPPKALLKLSNSFTGSVSAQLDKLALNYQSIEAFATPRRLALRVNSLVKAQKDTESVRLGPAVQAAFNDDGTPKPAALGFAKSCGLDINEVDQVDTDKGKRLQATVKTQGKPSESLLPEIIEQALELPALERAIVAEQLLLSLDLPDSKLDAIWSEEAEARINAYEIGDVGSLSMKEVFGKHDRS